MLLMLGILITSLVVAFAVIIVSAIIKSITFGSTAMTVMFVASVIAASCSIGILACALYALVSVVNGGVI